MAEGWRKHLVGDFSWRRLVFSSLGIYTVAGAFLYFKADGLIFLPPEASYAKATVKPLPAQSLQSLADLPTKALGVHEGWMGVPESSARFAPNPPRQAPPEGRYQLPWRDPGDPFLSLHWLPAKQARWVVLYSHGNAEDMGHVLPLLKAIQGLGASVLAYDYPGYGHSQGVPDRWNATASARRAYALLEAWGVKPAEQLVAYGRSVGGGPTMELASRLPVKALVLESSFTSVQRVRFPFPIFPFDAFRSAQAIAQLKLPTLIVHGMEDELIPFAHGQALYAAAAGPKRHLWVEGAGHDDLQEVAGPRWSLTLARFLADLDRGMGPDGSAL